LNEQFGAAFDNGADLHRPIAAQTSNSGHGFFIAGRRQQTRRLIMAPAN
jgi:hypothetical protein